MAPLPLPILLVEDNSELRCELATALRLEGYRVELARDGQEALQRLDRPDAEAPACLVLDVMMPVMDGRALLRQMRRRPHLQGIPVILYSAVTHAEEAGEAPVRVVLPKPFELRDLYAAVERCGCVRAA